MWLITTRGFYSAVEDKDDKDKVFVRARHVDDLNALKDLLPDAIPFRLTHRHSDYEWRIHVTKAEWAVACAQLAAEIDYGNFKDAVKHRQGAKRAGVYSRVWSVLLSLERRDRYSSSSYGAFEDMPLFRAKPKAKAKRKPAATTKGKRGSRR